MVRGLKKKFTVSEKNEWGMVKKKVVQAVNGLDLTVADKTIFCLLGCRHISNPILLFFAPSSSRCETEFLTNRAQWSGKDDNYVADYGGIVS